MKAIKILSGALVGLGAVFTAVTANRKDVGKTEKTSNVIFGLGSVAVGISGILAETAKEEREKAAKEVTKAANENKEEA